MENKKIEISKIEKKYSERLVLDIDNLIINFDEVTCIVGTSGAGKSTLLNILGTLEKPDHGQVLIQDDSGVKNIFDNESEYRKNNVGFVFQDMNLIDGLSIIDNINVAKSLSYEKSNDDIKTLLSDFGLKDLNQDASTLSGGEKQRAAIARAICKNAEIILADEPSGSLDSDNAHVVFNTLRSVRKGRAVIIVTHDLSLAKKYGDRIILLKDGKVAEDERITNSIDSEMNSGFASKNLKSSKFKSILNSIKLLGLNSIKKRFFRYLLVSIVLGLGISSISLALKYNKQGTIIANETNRNFLEADLLSIKGKQTLMMKNPGLSDEDIQKVLSETQTNQFVEDYSYMRFNLVFSYDSVVVPQTEVYVKAINYSSFFENRIMNENVIGSFPKNTNEIILGKSVASNMSPNDPNALLNKNITISDEANNSGSFKVVGINNVENAERHFYTYVSSEVLKDFRKKNISRSFREIKETRYEEVMGINYSLALKFGNYGIIYNTENLIYKVGEIAPKNDCINVIISSYIFENALASSRFGNTLDEKFQYLSNLNFSICTDLCYNCKIVGVFESDALEIRMFENDINKIFEVHPSKVYFYIDDFENCIDIAKNINEKYADIDVASEYQNLILGITHNYRFFSIALIVISILLSLISLFAVASLIKLINNERKREIGIIKSYGAKTGESFLILLFDIMFISLLMFCFSIVFSLIVCSLVPVLFKVYSFIEIGFPFGSICLLSLIFVCLLVLLTVLFVLKTIKKSPHELLIKNE